MPTAILFRLLADGPPGPDAALVPTLDLTTLTVHQAQQLDGRRVRAAFTASTLADGNTVEAEGPDDESRTVHFVEGTPPAIGERAVVEGVVMVREHGASVHGGVRFPAFV